jgi:hypothetical protein
VVESIVATILDANADSGAFTRIKNDLETGTISPDLELLESGDDVLCERRSIWGVLLDGFPAFGRRARWRDEEVFLQIGNLQEIRVGYFRAISQRTRFDGVKTDVKTEMIDDIQ